MDYIKILNWESFQHYKERSPPWIKLYNSLLNNEQFECLQDDSKVLLFCLWMLTSRKGNGKVPADSNYLSKHLPIHKKPSLQPLVEQGFIEICYQDDSKTIAVCKQNAIPETEQSRVETEQRQKKKFGEFVFLSDDEYKKLTGKYPEGNVKYLIEELNTYIGSKGTRYKSHYYTLLNWARRKQIPVMRKPMPEPKKEPEKPIIPPTLEKMAELRKKIDKIFDRKPEPPIMPQADFNAAKQKQLKELAKQPQK